ncbi:MAG: response regulator transcription factor [Pseudomonadota bacterium]
MLDCSMTTREEAPQGAGRLDGARVAIIDDHALFASGLALVLAGEGASATAVFSDPTGFLSTRDRGGWDVLILDYFIPGHGGAEAIGALRRAAPGAAVLVVSGSVSTEDRRAALEAGAAAFLSKTAPPERLAGTVAALVAHAPPIAEPVALPNEAVGLSPRQTEILNGVARGRSNKEIARGLDVSPETVKTHLSEIYRRLEVAGRMEAVAAARARGLA